MGKLLEIDFRAVPQMEVRPKPVCHAATGVGCRGAAGAPNRDPAGTTPSVNQAISKFLAHTAFRIETSKLIHSTLIEAFGDLSF